MNTEPTPSSHRLHSLSIAYQTFLADTTGKAGFNYTWTNNLGFPIFVAGVEIWIGEQGGAITDTPYSLVNVSQNEVIVSSGWDHYAAPTGINDNLHKDFWGECYYLVMPNDNLLFTISSTSYNGNEYISAGCMIRYRV